MNNIDFLTKDGKHHHKGIESTSFAFKDKYPVNNYYVPFNSKTMLGVYFSYSYISMCQSHRE